MILATGKTWIEYSNIQRGREKIKLQFFRCCNKNKSNRLMPQSTFDALPLFFIRIQCASSVFLLFEAKIKMSRVLAVARQCEFFFLPIFYAVQLQWKTWFYSTFGSGAVTAVPFASYYNFRAVVIFDDDFFSCRCCYCFCCCCCYRLCCCFGCYCYFWFCIFSAIAWILCALHLLKMKENNFLGGK